MIWLDRIIIAGIVALVVFTPLAIGSVNPWSFCTAEVVIFLLTIVWMARLALEQSPRTFPGLRSLLIPVASFISLVLFQLLPLPPALMHTFSPSTYALYATSLPGWPDRNPYSEPPLILAPIKTSTGWSRQARQSTKVWRRRSATA